MELSEDLIGDVVTKAFFEWANQNDKDPDDMTDEEVAMWMLGYIEAMKVAFKLFEKMEYKKDDDGEPHAVH